MNYRVPTVPKVPTATEREAPVARKGSPNGHSIEVLLETLTVLGYDVSCHQADQRLAYNEQEAAQLLSISPRTLFTLRKEGKVRAIKVGNRVIYSRDELLRFLNSSTD